MRQTGSRNRGWLSAIRRRLESYGGHVGNRLSVAAGVALAVGMMAAFAPRAEAVSATGGTVTNAGGYTYHVFTNSGTFTNNSLTAVDVFLVAGGGGGGGGAWYGPGGGGAGGVVLTNGYTVTPGNNYTITVGGGGNGGTGTPETRGGNGTNSAFGIVLTNAVGGGGGGKAHGELGWGGGCGGGGASANNGGTGSQGKDGGRGLGDGANSPSYGGGGGGGCTVTGSTGKATSGGDGGAGTNMTAWLNSLSLGDSGWFAGGGVGGAYDDGQNATKPNGGGGYGGSSTKNGVPNTGGGGAGARKLDTTGGNGGSGIVIVRYVTLPSITGSDTSHGFGDTFLNATGTWSYTVSGANLNNDITITAPSSEFTIATNGGTFGSQVVLAQTSGSVPTTTINVHFIPTAEQAYSGTITNASAGADDQLVTLTGNGLSASVPILTVAPTSLGFGNAITNKNSANQMITVTGANLTNDVTVTAPSSSFAVSTNGTDFSPSVTLATNGTGGIDITNIYVRFTPSAGSGPYSGNITNGSAGAANKLVAVTGTGLVQGISVSVASLNFGYVQTTTTSNLTYTVSGSNLEADVTLTLPGGSGFTIKTNGGSFGTSVTLTVPNQSQPAGGTLAAQTIAVQFAPTAVQSYGPTAITAASAGAVSQATTLSGNGAVQQIGVQQPAGTPLTDGSSTIDLGSTAGAVKTFVVTNSGSILLTLTGITKDGANPSDFTASALPASLAAGASTTFTVRFTPTATGARSAGLHIGNGTSDGSFDVSLTGTGVLEPPFLAFGGDIRKTIIGRDGYIWAVHTFTNSGTFNMSVGSTGVEYLVVGGGGGGGKQSGGSYSSGGGGGGYRSSCSEPGELSGSNSPPESTLTVVASSNYTVTIGAGGAGDTTPGANGSPSVFGPITALGGGGGGCDAGASGGCGGGGGGTGTSGQGFDGGAIAGFWGAGGGGAGGKGGPGNNGTGIGGVGLASMIDWVPGITRASGGTGQRHPIVNGAPNTGNGGDGTDITDITGGNGGTGGSGIVIIRYRASAPLPGPRATGGTLTNYFSTNGMNFAVHVFSNSADFVVTRAGYVDVLAVGGGGGGASGGGDWSPGGGGAGGMLETLQYAVTAGTYSVSVGGGGSGGIGAGGGGGTNSSFGALTAYGGGGGGYHSASGAAGGSGGGGGETSYGGLCTNGQGNVGGYHGGGGGGAGTAGGDNGGAGGTGRGSYITGTGAAVTRAGGGGGSYPGASGGGGSGGGGSAGTSGSPNGVAGIDGLGGGGGGGYSRSAGGNGAKGGKGIVIVRYTILPPSGTVIMMR